MIRKFSVIISLFLILILCASCASINARKHLEKARKLDKAGRLKEANAEYIRALRGISDKKVLAEIHTELADNYREARRYQEAAKHYKKAIKNYNYIKLPAPYEKLAMTYMLQGSQGAASAVLKDIDRETPQNAAEIQTRICRMLAVNNEQKGEWGQAKYFYEQMLAYAKKAKNERFKNEAEQKIKFVTKMLKRG